MLCHGCITVVCIQQQDKNAPGCLKYDPTLDDDTSPFYCMHCSRVLNQPFKVSHCKLRIAEASKPFLQGRWADGPVLQRSMGQKTLNALLILHVVWYDEAVYSPAKVIRETLLGHYFGKEAMVGLRFINQRWCTLNMTWRFTSKGFWLGMRDGVL